MSELLVYVMTSDRGKAPKVKGNICVLEGCKKKTIEKYAKSGDWIIGIGGKALKTTLGTLNSLLGRVAEDDAA